jgi:hypothetical protein
MQHHKWQWRRLHEILQRGSYSPADLGRSLHRPGFMNVLSPSTPMMIKKKTKDTRRKNVARSSVIMMPHPLCYQGEP